MEAGDAVKCKCDDEAVKQVVKKEGKNKGRIFFHCGNRGKKCSFWRWGTKEEQEKEKETENGDKAKKGNGEDTKESSGISSDESSTDSESDTTKSTKSRKRASTDKITPITQKSTKLG